MPGISESLYGYAIGAEYQTFYTVLFNTYFPFGMFFWFIGFLIFGISHLKTKNFTYSGAYTSLYFIIISSTGLVTNAYATTALRWFGLGLGIVTGYYIYRTLNK